MLVIQRGPILSAPGAQLGSLYEKSLLKQAHARIDQLLDWQRENKLPIGLTIDKKYQIYATTLLEAVNGVAQKEEAILYNTQRLDADLGAIIAQMHQYATCENALRAPSLEVFARAQGNETVNRLVFLFIKQFTESVNIKHTLTLHQTVEMASLVQLEFRDLSLTDVLLCLRNTKSGKYGQLYESFDFVKLGEFLRKYRDEKDAIRSQKHIDLKYTQSSILYDIVSHLDKAPEEFREAFQSKSAQQIAQSMSEEGKAQKANTQQTDAQTSDATQSDRPSIGVDLNALFADQAKPDTKPRKPKPISEREHQQRIIAELTPQLHHMKAADFDYYIDYYQTYRQTELVTWLTAEKERHLAKPEAAKPEPKKARPEKEEAQTEATVDSLVTMVDPKSGKVQTVKGSVVKAKHFSEQRAVR